MNDNFNEEEKESEDTNENNQEVLDDWLENMQKLNYGAICKSCSI